MKKGDFFLCKCGTAQGYAPEGERGGVTEEELLSVGWTKYKGEYFCPACSGNEDMLMEIFLRSRPVLHFLFEVTQFFKQLIGR